MRTDDQPNHHASNPQPLTKGSAMPTNDELHHHASNPTTPTKGAPMKPTRVHALKARIAARKSSADVRTLVDTMTRDLDPNAIPCLIDLLDHEHREHVERGLAQYGAHAEEILLEELRQHAKGSGKHGSLVRVLARIAYRARIHQARFR